MEQQLLTKNNVPVYFYTNPNLHSFCLCLYVKAGLVYESNETNGITHLWEHMIFRNINHLMNHTLYQRLDQLGLSFEGYTYREFVQFKITGAVRHFPEAIDIFMKVLEPMQLPSPDFQVEKKRIKAEIREDDDKSTLDYFTGRIIWQGTALENTIAGTPKVIDKIGIKALQNAHRNFLSANNLFVYVTGCVDEFHIRQLADRLESVSFFTTAEERNNLAPVPAEFFHRNCQVAVKNCSYTYIRFSFDIQVSRYTQAELDLLYGLLFEGDSCKILKELSDETGYIYSYDARLEKYNNIGCLYFLYEVQLCNLIDSIKRVVHILKDLKNGSCDTLVYVKAPDIDNADFMLDNDEDLNWNMAYECHIMNSRFRSVGERKQMYAEVTPERITEIAKEIFKPDNLVVTLKGSSKRINIDEIRLLMQSLE